MNINQIKYVLEVAASSSMREASAKLFVSQPAISASIRELEDELGILIFERTNKGISLTDAGREFLVYAKKAVAQYEILEDRYLSKDSDKERFSVSTQHYNFAIRAFTEVIRKNAPEKFIFSIHETKTKEVLEDVGNLKSEVGIISFSGASEGVIRRLFRDYQLEFTPLMRREAYAYVWTDYAFDKIIKSDDRATSMEIIAELGGYSIGSGMLAGEDAILQGLVSIKLKEEDPLVIGYITRKGSAMSLYGKAYIEELLKYKEL